VKVLMDFVHHEPTSFNAALRDHALATLAAAGHEVRLSDLWARGFNPVAAPADVGVPAGGGPVNYLLAQREAAARGLFAEDIRREQEKVAWADFLLVQSPVWWFSVPAILKGWFDRVLAAGFAWDFGRIYGTAPLRGKRGMLAVTTGGPEASYSDDGPHGATLGRTLWHVTHGTLHFCGLEVLPTFVAWSVFQAGDEGRARYLREYGERLRSLETTAPMEGHGFAA
jgi:NAD(P)H dehydrogenase (quinone)